MYSWYIPILFGIAVVTHERSMSDCSKSVIGTKFVVLLRISTNKSGGVDSHGIDAQRREVELFLSQQDNPHVIKQLVEVKSGASKQRPVLEEALALCRKHKATLLVSRLSRLSRDACFVLNLMNNSKVQFCVASMPNATNFQLGIYALLNQQERETLSRRTKQALASARARGVKLGNPKNLEEFNRRRKRDARTFADSHSGLIHSLRREGKTLRQICELLNDSGISTRNGGVFHPVQVSRILHRSQYQDVAGVVS